MEKKARKRIPLSRGWKTLRNLVLLAAALGLCWGLTRVPLWLTQRALEVGAEEQGAEETELLWRGNLPVLFEGGGGAPFAGQDTMPVVLARSGQTVWSCHMDSYEGDIFLDEPTGRTLPEGPCLICPLFSGYAAIPTEEGVTAVLAAVNLPEGTASAQVELSTADGQTRTAQGEREMDVILFSIPGDEGWGPERYEALSNAPYTLTFLDEEGQVLLETAGRLTVGWTQEA